MAESVGNLKKLKSAPRIFRLLMKMASNSLPSILQISNEPITAEPITLNDCFKVHE